MRAYVSGLALAAALMAASGANAQDLYCTSAESDLASQSGSGLMSALESRYSRASEALDNPAIVNSVTNVFSRAQNAAAHCAIAIGYLKTGEIDQGSINRCDCFSSQLNPAPLPPPPPPPPPPGPVCEAGVSLTVYFAFDRATLSQEATSALDSAAAEARQCGFSSALIDGHTDRSGPESYNQALSERRAGSVADYLASAGFDRSRITTRAFGERQTAAPTPDGVREPLNRRVETRITFAPSPDSAEIN